MDKDNPTQFGRAMAELGIEMIAGYSPQARGRSERLFGTLQGRLPQELAKAGITGMDEGNASFAMEPESAFVLLLLSDEGEAARSPLPEGGADGWQ
ncbi:MAG: hypothetical protein F4139_12820 [Gemmatimonadetes bacterium]|nr:hypothetical protein [Gemmatimonadota bacterium]MYH53804.1 hypothetical protein [Gemmatimonadota bacterium]MYK65269.1 hypothetical protein [Gemmatimonadota bacterium]